MAEIPEAPYLLTYDTVNVEGKEVKVFRLGKYGKEKLKKAIDSDTLNVLKKRWNSEILELRNRIDILTEIFGGQDKIVAYFKEKFLQRMKMSAKHRSDLVGMPFWFEKKRALDQLLEEGQVFYSPRGGWIKLKEA